MDDGDETRILVPGYEITPAELPKMALRSYNLATANGWTAKAGYSKFQDPVKTYGDKAAKAGETHGGDMHENHWIDAIHETRKVRFTAVWIDGSFVHARINTWHVVKSTVLGKFIKGEVEIDSAGTIQEVGATVPATDGED